MNEIDVISILGQRMWEIRDPRKFVFPDLYFRILETFRGIVSLDCSHLILCGVNSGRHSRFSGWFVGNQTHTHTRVYSANILSNWNTYYHYLCCCCYYYYCHTTPLLLLIILWYYFCYYCCCTIDSTTTGIATTANNTMILLMLLLLHYWFYYDWYCYYTTTTTTTTAMLLCYYC
jgi:hypothetical protein